MSGANVDMWHDAADEIQAVHLLENDNLTVDQRLKLAEIQALLAIGQELSLLVTGLQVSVEIRDQDTNQDGSPERSAE